MRDIFEHLSLLLQHLLNYHFPSIRVSFKCFARISSLVLNGEVGCKINNVLKFSLFFKISKTTSIVFVLSCARFLFLSSLVIPYFSALSNISFESDDKIISSNKHESHAASIVQSTSGLSFNGCRFFFIIPLDLFWPVLLLIFFQSSAPSLLTVCLNFHSPPTFFQRCGGLNESTVWWNSSSDVSIYFKNSLKYLLGNSESYFFTKYTASSLVIFPFLTSCAAS